jgi:predicted glycoside hydrolase/deacetylase ChbG (UPF0249 family)
VSAPGPRTLAVCVDDFGLHEGVNQAVLALLALRRISAVSCLVDGPAWASGAAALRAAAWPAGEAEPIADVGLHLNFTELLDARAQRPDLVRPLGALIRACHLRRFDEAALQEEVARQFARFEAVWGRPPDFVDGHQHVHQFPQLREALAQVLRARQVGRDVAHRPWLRLCRSPGWAGWRAGIGLVDTLKAAVIAALGASALARQARRLGLPHSERLLGVYPFDADEAGFLRRWQAWLSLVHEGDLLMCHPAVPQSQAVPQPDVIAAARHMEFQVLSSPGFGQRLSQAGVRIARLAR